MAITQNTYTGNNSTTAYSFTFPYLETTDIKVSLDAVDTTAYTLSNATTITFNAAPATGVAIRIYRNTATDNLTATFYPGSAIRSSDLNNNFIQNLYVTQESAFDVSEASAAGTAATTAANTATTTANTALTNAATANTTANAAAATANTANTNANTAISDSATALSTANSANAAVSNAVLFTLVANVAAIPGSPSSNDFIEVSNSTGIQSFTPLSGVPGGFVGDSGLTARIRYDGSASSWVWMSYFPNDSETRYLKDASFIETPQVITVNKVIAANSNAGMMGPTVSINSGISITVGTNTLLTVLK